MAVRPAIALADLSAVGPIHKGLSRQEEIFKWGKQIVQSDGSES